MSSVFFHTSLSPANGERQHWPQRYRHPRASRAANFLIQFARSSSVHGLNHVSTSARRHPGERMVWLVCVGLCTWGAAQVSLITWRHYQQTPTVISLERDYKAWNTSFPAITMCFDKKTDPRKVKAVSKELCSKYNIENETSVALFLDRLVHATYDNLDMIPNVTSIPGDAFTDLVLRVVHPLNATITSINTDSNFNPRLHMTWTEIGLCYSFNSLMAVYFSPRYWLEGAVAQDGDSTKEVLELNPLDGEVYAQINRVPGSYRLYVHGPGEVPDLLSRSTTSPLVRFKTLEVSALATVTTREARNLSPDQRRCRFMDEPPDGSGMPAYSYNACRRFCRARLAREACQCVPHFYGPSRGANQAATCDAKGLHCIAKYSGNLQRLLNPFTGEKARCGCLATCDDVQYTIESDNDVPWFLGTDLKWGLFKYPRMRLKRDVIFGFSDVLVSVGSSAGLFLGCSVLSFIEIIYFFTLRLFLFWWNSRSEYQIMKTSGNKRTAQALTRWLP